MSGMVDVQARISTIASRIDSLANRGARPAVDPLVAQAFASSLGSALSSQGVTMATATAATGLDLSSLPGPSVLPGVTGAAGLPPVAGPAPTTGAPAPAGPAGPDGADVVAAARKYLGVPYRWGGTDPSTGLDCSGLVQRVFADLGVKVPRTVAEQRTVGEKVDSMADARPGDLLAFASAGSPSGRHIGIYVGDGQMLSAPSKGKDVRISPVWSDVAAIRRVVPAEGSTATASTATASTAVMGGTAAAGVSAGVRPAWAAGGDLASTFAAATARYDLPAGLLQAVAQRESGMRTDAVSPAGARGLMQLMPATARSLGVDPMVPVQAVDGAARYLRQQLDTFGSLDLALAAYNAGPGNVRKHGGIPPFAETQKYVAAITAALGRG